LVSIKDKPPFFPPLDIVGEVFHGIYLGESRDWEWWGKRESLEKECGKNVESAVVVGFGN
jgi:hypothetical protein